MMRRSSILGVVLATLVYAPGIASADWSSSTLWDSGNSPQIDRIETFITPGTSALFANPGVVPQPSLLGDGRPWQAQMINPTFVLLTGPAATDVGYWQYLFQGSVGTASMDYFSYSGNTLVWSGRIDQNINYLQIGGLDPASASYNRSSSSVPLPQSFILFLSGLFCLVAVKRRRYEV